MYPSPQGFREQFLKYQGPSWQEPLKIEGKGDPAFNLNPLFLQVMRVRMGKVIVRKLGSWLTRIWQRFLVRRKFYKFNKLLYDLSLRGLGINNLEAASLTGEEFFLRGLRFPEECPLIMDVGGGVGRYALWCRKVWPTAKIISFEPNPRNFGTLQKLAEENDFLALPYACGDASGKVKLYDISGMDSSEHASVYREVIDKICQKDVVENEVDIVRLDDWCKFNGIDRIDLLKLDTEGNEFKVLLGARELLEKNGVNVIQFEFNEMNVYSRVYFKDFYELLSNYRLYRLLPDGMIPIERYRPALCEIFVYQNIVAMNKGFETAIL